MPRSALRVPLRRGPSRGNIAGPLAPDVTRPLTPDEAATAALLTRAGLAREGALCLAALLARGPMRRAELAEATGLTPQSVSGAARELASERLVVSEPIPRAGPGRPELRARVAGEAREVLAGYVARRKAELDRERAALDDVLASMR